MVVVDSGLRPRICCTLRLVGRVYDRRYVPDQVKVKVNGV